MVVELASHTAAGEGAVCVEGLVLFAPGQARSSEGFVLRQNRGRGAAVPTELEATGAYPDGSVRAARLVASVPAALVRAGAVFHLVRGRSPPPSEPVRVRESESGVVLEAGGLALEFASTGPDLLRRVDARGAAWRVPDRAARVVASTDLGVASSERDSARAVVIERSGPLRSVLRTGGFAFDVDDRAVLAWTLRVEARAGREPMRFTLDVEGLEDVGIAEDIALEIPLCRRGVVRVRVLGAELAGPLERGVARVASDDGRHVDAFLGGTRAGLDAARRCGLASEDARGDGIGLVVSRLRPYAPRAVELTDDGVLRLLAHSGPVLLDADTRLRVRGAIGPLAARSPAARLALEQEPSDRLFGLGAAAIALPTDEPFTAAALEPTTPGTLRALARLDSALEACVGARDFGDYRLGDGFANLEYDPARGFYAAWLGTRDPAFAATARAMVEHWVRFDRSAGEGEVGPGLPFQHGFDHRSLTFEPGHVWAGGVVLAALLDGDPAAAGAARELSRALIDLVAESERFDEERSYAWLLLALCDLDLLGPDPELRAARGRLARQLLQRQHADGYFAIDRAQPGGGVVAVTPWVTGGITLQALARCRRLDGDGDGLRDALVRAADFLAVHARRKDGAFADKVAFGVELGAEFQPQGRAEPVDEIMICAGLMRALELEDNGTWSTIIEERLVRALIDLERSIRSPNEAARALAALRVLRLERGATSPARR